MRFAAKEAIVKAMGTGFSKDIWLKDIGIDKDNKGKPFVIFSNKGIKIKESLGIGSSYISLSDDDGLVVAFSILMSLDK
jgi:holo-[acyl-carrier-protein] synthase